MNTKADRTPVFVKLRKARIHETYWAKKILAAEKRDNRFTESGIEEARNWTTCACGRVNPEIETLPGGGWNKAGCPKDFELRVAGKNFYNAVRGHLVMMATDCLIAIEKRAREIHNGAQLRTPK